MRVHLVGIGGIGLSAIARVLHGQGYEVSGSDLHSSILTSALAAEGITVFEGHRSENLGSPDDLENPPGLVVVVSSAIPEDNPEVLEARRRRVPVVKRQQLLGELTSGCQTVAVAGTHGKTTTSAMIAWILSEAGLDPSFIVGGVLWNLATNARAGQGQFFVIEADEYDRAFLGLRPHVAVLTTLEHDHPDCYPTYAEMEDAYASFAQQIVTGGLLVTCRDSEGARRFTERFESLVAFDSGHEPRQVLSYGSHPGSDWQAVDIRLEGSPTFETCRGGENLGKCALQLPGRHNVLNALAALACTHELGVEFEVAAGALTRFRGTERRFEVKGQAGGVTVVDDYAHHPTEIEATLAAARSRFPGQAIWAVFQPHTYSRTQALMDRFATAFCDADHVLVTSIYAAREQNTLGVSGADLVERMRASGVCATADNGNGLKQDVQYVGSLEQTADALTDRVRPGDVVVTLGAGDGYLVGERLLRVLQDRENNIGSGIGAAVVPSHRAHGHWRAFDRWAN